MSDPVAIVADAALTWGRLGAVIAAGLAVLVLPGLALAASSGYRGTAADRLAAAPGLSVLVVTLSWWCATLTGVGLTTACVTGGIALCAAVAAVRLAAASRAPRNGNSISALIGLAAVWLATLLVRLATIHDLALPAWVDGVHHTYLTNLLRQTGAVPSDYGPLLGFGPFSYHFGFHALAASSAALVGAAAPDAVLSTGQLLSAAAAPAAYLLARLYRATSNGALIAATVAGLVSVMPAYYVSWSRFTELAGLIALPAWLLLARPALDGHWQAAVLGCASAGLVLVHPRVAVMAALLLLAEVLIRRRSVLSLAFAQPARAVTAGAVALALAGPWLWRLAGGLIPRLGIAPPGVEAVNALELTALATAYDPWVYGLATAVAAAGVLSGVHGARVAMLWLVLVLAAANPGRLGLPSTYFLSNGSVVIALWLPAAALVGGGVGWLLMRARPRLVGRARLPDAAIAAVIVALGLALASGARDTLNPGTVLATANDRLALEAAAAILPADAVIAVNVREWQLQTYMGSDGGYFVGVVTPGRAIVPPLLYGLGPPDRARATSEQLRLFQASATEPRQLVPAMRAIGADWLFLGEHSHATSASTAELEPVVVAGSARLYRLRTP